MDNLTFLMPYSLIKHSCAKLSEPIVTAVLALKAKKQKQNKTCRKATQIRIQGWFWVILTIRHIFPPLCQVRQNKISLLIKNMSILLAI